MSAMSGLIHSPLPKYESSPAPDVAPSEYATMGDVNVNEMRKAKVCVVYVHEPREQCSKLCASHVNEISKVKLCDFMSELK